MKKIILLILFVTFMACGCGKVDKDKMINKFINKVNDTSSYHLKGAMEIVSDEDTYLYDIDVNYQKKNKYKVGMINQTNNHEQIILRNNDGVYVVTPSLNKSYKFQSEWPDNSSQAYILSALVKDIKNDPESTLTEEKDKYVLQTKVNYPNNNTLAYEKLTFDKDMNLETVYVYDNNDTPKIKVTFNKIDYKANLKDDIFKLESYIDENCCEETEKTGLIDNIIYPLYIPQDTYLDEKETINTTDGERVILTFTGLKKFILVEETANISDDFEVIPVYGDPYLLEETYGVLSANSLTWTKGNVDYYLSSNDLTNEEMLSIAVSLNNGNTISVGK